MKLRKRIVLELPSVMDEAELRKLLDTLIDEFHAWPDEQDWKIPEGTELRIVLQDVAAERAVEALLDDPEPEPQPVLVAANRIDITDAEALAILEERYTTMAGTPACYVKQSVRGKGASLRRELITQWMDECGLTVPELASLLGMGKTNTTPYNWLDDEGYGMPSVENLAKLASLMERNPLDLIEERA